MPITRLTCSNGHSGDVYYPQGSVREKFSTFCAVCNVQVTFDNPEKMMTLGDVIDKEYVTVSVDCYDCSRRVSANFKRTQRAKWRKAKCRCGAIYRVPNPINWKKE